MAGTNLNAATSGSNPTLWLERLEPIPTGVGDIPLAISATCTGAPPTTANIFKNSCTMQRQDLASGNGFFLNTGTAASPIWSQLESSAGGTATALVDNNGFVAMAVGTTANAVNQITVTDAATGTAPTLTATGSDTNISFNIAPKGTGGMTLGSATGTSDMIFGSSSGAQAVKIANGTGAATVNIANVSTAGSTLTALGAVTAAGNTDTVNVATGNAAATGIKVVNVLTGTPGTSGNNRFTVGAGVTTKATFNAAVTSYQAINYIASETGANNAIVVVLTDASGNNITLAAGLRIVVLLAHSLQAGANTCSFNGTVKNITSHRNTGNTIGTAYVSGGLVDLMYDGTQFQDMSQ